MFIPVVSAYSIGELSSAEITFFQARCTQEDLESPAPSNSTTSSTFQRITERFGLEQTLKNIQLSPQYHGLIWGHSSSYGKHLGSFQQLPTQGGEFVSFHATPTAHSIRFSVAHPFVFQILPLFLHPRIQQSIIYSARFHRDLF